MKKTLPTDTGMNPTSDKRNLLTGYGLALITIVIWSGNYVVARGISGMIPPVSMSFFRWGTASVFISIIGWKSFREQRSILLKHKWYLLCTAITGITLFNTFIYVAGHFTSAINLALIGSTAWPVFITILSRLFLKERVSSIKIVGMICCIAGILLLLSKGSWQQLLEFRFGKGDLWILASSIVFSIYTILVRKKPADIKPMSFLFTLFLTGTLCLLPFYITESVLTGPLHWTSGMVLIILYVGIGNSVIGFLCWNASIARIGPSATGIFSNLMPVFSTIEAVLFLNEQFTVIHLISGLVVATGLIIANLK